MKHTALITWSHENFRTHISPDKILLFFHSILPTYAKSNTRVAIGMTPNC